MPSIYKAILWPAQDKEAVGKTQDLVQNIPAILNGNLVNPYYPNNMSFSAHGYIRSVSINSANDLSAIKFHITGIQNGLVITDEIVGPTAGGTVYSTTSYETVLSIVSIDGDAAGVSFGSGNTGFFNLIEVNTSESTLTSTALQMIIPQGGTDLTYSIYFTLDKNAVNNFIKLDDLISQGTYLNPDNTYIDQTTSKIFFGLPPVVLNVFLVKVTTTSVGAEGKLIFIQL